MKISSALLVVFVLLFMSSLVQAQTSLVTCKTPSQDKTFCLDCRDYYHLYEGQCYINILGCQSYVFGNICRKCAKGFILVNNECCDRACMSKIYNQEHHESKVAENKEEVLRKAEVDGLEKSIAAIAKNSVKIGQNYDILSTKSQRFDKIFRYFVDLQIEGKQYTATNDYNIVTGASAFVCITPKGEFVGTQITLTEENIHGNKIYEEGYKFIYEKYGLQLYDLQFSRMTAINYGRTTELKYVFVGAKVLLISAMISEQLQPYILWKEEKNNVEEVKAYIQNLKKVESVSKEFNFRQVFTEVLAEKKYKESDVEIVDITPVSQEEYIFIIYHKIYRIRFRIKGFYSVKNQKTTVENVEEVFSTKLQDIKEPEPQETKVITKEQLSNSVEAKEIFDYLYKIQPTFRQNLVENVKIEEGDSVKKMFVLSKRDGKEYRMVILKDNQSQDLQLIDEGFVSTEKSTATILTANNDGTTTVTTNKIDQNQLPVKTVMETLSKNNIDTNTIKIQSLQYTEGPKSIEYVAVLIDGNGNPTKQVTITQDKQTKEASIIDYKTLQPEVRYIKPVQRQVTVIPVSEYYKPEVKQLITKVESKVDQKITITKVNKIEVSETSNGKKYDFIVEDTKGNQMQIAVVQVNGDTGVEVVKMQPYVPITAGETIMQQTKVVKKVDEFGVKSEYTNDQKAINTNQNVNAALTAITNQQPELADYEIVSVQTKDFVQQQEQILILTNGTRTVQVIGTVDQKTLRYVKIQQKQIPVTVTYPMITQNTIPAEIYPIVINENKSLKESQAVLLQKYKIFKNKVPSSTTIQSLQKVEIMTFNYQVSEKRFIAVVQYNKTDKKDIKIIEVSPVESDSKPVKIDQTTFEGKTVTTTNSEDQIKDVNKNAESVLKKIVTEYPLLKKQNITEVTLTESDYSDVFEITYTDETTKMETTVTVRSDKKGNNVTIEDVDSGDSTFSDAVKVVDAPQVVVKESEYDSTPVQKVVEAINKTNVPVDKITKIVTETAPNYVTYNMEIESSNKSYDVTVRDSNNTQEVVAVRSPNKTIQVQSTVKPTIVKQVDNNGNKIIKTNDAKYIASMTEIKAVVEEIKLAKKEVSDWAVDSVTVVDYGTVERLTVTLVGPKPSEAVTSTVYYDKTSEKVEVATVESVQLSTTSQKKQVFYGSVVPVSFPTTSIPGVAVPNAIKTDESLSFVITYIYKFESQWLDVVPSSAEIKPISEKMIQYTVVMEKSSKKEQIVVVYNSETKESKVVTTSEVKSVTPYYLTETVSDIGTTVESNNVQEIIKVQPEFTEVLGFTKKYVKVSEDGKEVSNIKVVPSSVEGGSTVYIIEAKTQNQLQTIEVSYNTKTKEMTVLNLQVESVKEVFLEPLPIVKVDSQKNEKQINQYKTVIQDSRQTAIGTVKEIISVEKEISESKQKVYVEVVNTNDEKYYVTLETKTGEKPTVANVESGQTVKIGGGEEGSYVQFVDHKGSKVVQITGANLIEKDASSSASAQVVKAANQKLQNYEVISSKVVDLGEKSEVTLTLQNKDNIEDTVHAITIYNQNNNTAEIVSVQPVALPVRSETKEEGATSGEAGEAVITEKKIPVFEYPTKKIPQILVPQVIKTDKPLQKVIKTVQDSSSAYKDVVPSSVQVQKFDKQISKYTVVMEAQGVSKQIVTFYNSSSGETKTISTAEVPVDVKSTYSQESTSASGETVYSSNNVTSLMTTFVDLKFVLEETSKLVDQIDLNEVNIAVIPQDSVNSYTIQTVKGQNKITVELNYEVITNRTYVTNYKIEPIEVKVPEQPTYYPDALAVDDKVKYIDLVKDSGISEMKSATNVIDSKTTEYALYTETILEIETKESKRYYVKVIKQEGEQAPKVVNVNPIPSIPTATVSDELKGESQDDIGQDQTTVKTDGNGNEVTISTSEEQIERNQAVNASLESIIKLDPRYFGYKIKYIKTINFGLIEEVMATMINPLTGVIDTQAVSFYNKQTKIPHIVSVEPIKQPTPDEPVVFKPLYPKVVLSDSAIIDTIKKDSGLKTVLTTIHSSGSQYQSSVPLTVEVQPVGGNITKYVVVLDIDGQKEQMVYTYDNSTQKPAHYATTVVPSQVVSKITTQTVIDNKEVTISNSVEQVKKVYPQTGSVVAVLSQQKPNNTVESVMVVPESNSTSITLISQGENKAELVISKYTSSKQKAEKVDEQIIKISDVAVPKPIVSVPIVPTTISQIPVVQNEVKKIVNTDASKALNFTKITSVTVSKNTNVQVYEIRAADANDKPVSIQIVYNPATQQSTVVNVAEVKPQKMVATETLIKQKSGVSEVTTTNTTAIKSTKEYKQISDFLIKNHPGVVLDTAVPVVEKTDKYQRSIVKTIAFQQQNKTIQATYVLDQRTQSIVELSYEELPTVEKATVDLPKKPKENVLTPTIIPQAIKTNKVVTDTVTSINKVDPTLQLLVPTYIYVIEYLNSSIITIIYDTPDSNTRILTIYNAVTKEAKVTDYTKIPKNITGSKTVEKTNELGQKEYYTDTVTTTITQSKEYIEVMTVADELIPSIKNKPIKGFETISKATGTEYKIVTVDKGVVNQVVLQFNNKTKEAVLISSSESSVANEVTKIMKKTEKKPTSIDVETLHGNEIGQLVKTIAAENPVVFDKTASVISGNVVETEYVEIYELTLETKTETRKTITITKNKTTKTIVVNDIKPEVKPAVPLPISTVTTSDNYGNIQTTTNDQKAIKESKDTQNAIRYMAREKPQLAVMNPISTTTVTYGDIIENTVVFTSEKQNSVQITTITNNKTKTVSILDSKIVPISYQPIRPVYIAPSLPVQVLPTSAIPLAIKKYPELKEIVASVQKLEVGGKVEEISVEQFSTVKKYKAITSTSTGKSQSVYVYDKGTNKATLINTVPVAPEVKPVYYKKSTNNVGEEVTTSTSVDQMASQSPEVKNVVDEIKKKYNVDVSTTTKVIEIKGTTIKQVRIVTQTEKKNEVVFTGIVNGTAIQIINVQETTPVKAEPIVLKPVVSGKPSAEIKPEIAKPVEDVVFANPTIKRDFAEGVVKSFKYEETSFVSNYQVVIVNKKGETAVVELIQEPGQPISVVNIQGNPEVTVPKSDEPVKTEMTVAPKTGNKIVTTTDSQVIKSDITLKYLTQNIVAKLPDLVQYVPIKADTTTYGISKEASIIFAVEGKRLVQVTVIFDTNTNKVDVINTQEVKPQAKPLVQTIPAAVVETASKKIVEIKTIISSIEGVVEGSPTIQQIQVKELDQVKIYTSIISLPSAPDSKTQFVFVYNKATKQIKQVDKVFIESTVKAITYQKTTDHYGETIIKTNDVETIKQEKPEIKTVLANIDSTYGEGVSKTIKTVQMTQQNATTEYQFVTEVQGKFQEIMVINKNGKIDVVKMQDLPSAQQSKIITIEQKPLSEVETVEIGGEDGVAISNTIKNSGIISLKNSQIVSIKSQENLLTTLYTVQTKNEKNQVQVVTISVAPEQKPQIVQIEPVKEEIKTAVVEESLRDKQISEVTGAQTTVTTDRQEVAKQAEPLTKEVIKAVPEIINSTPVSVKTTDLGEISWKTVVYRDQKNVVQVTSLINTTDSTVVVIDKKLLNQTVSGSKNVPETQEYTIPAAAIPTTSKKLPEITKVVTEVQKSYKKATIESIQIQVFGVIEKVVAVVDTPAGKVNVEYLVNKTTNEVKLIETIPVPAKIEGAFYSQTTNKYGQTTIMTNNVTEIIANIPVVEDGIKFIKSKYPVTSQKPVKIVKVIQYENEYQVNYVSQVDANNPFAVVVSIDKKTGETTEISKYTKVDVEAVEATSGKEIKEQAEPVKEAIPTDNPAVASIIKYVEDAPEIPINKIQTVTKAEKTTSILGTETVTIEGVTARNQKIKTQVTYNPVTGDIGINTFDVVSQPVVPKNVVTEFKVDTITGTKLTVTNNPTVLASSEMMKTITEKVKTTDATLEKVVLTSSTTTQYPDKVKVVSIFTDEATDESIQVVSIFNKETSEVSIIETDRSVQKTVPSIPREVLNAGELPEMESKYPSIPATTALIKEKLPQYINEKPTTVIVETLKEVQFVSYIFQTKTIKNQVVVVYNKTSKKSEVIQSSPVVENTKPFFYEQKTNDQGDEVITTNNLTVVTQRIPTTTVLKDYIEQNEDISVDQIQTVELTVGEKYLDYTLVIKTSEGVTQHEYLVNSETKEVKAIDKKVITDSLPIVGPKTPVVTVISAASEQFKPMVTQIIDNPETNLNSVKSIVNVTKQTVSKGSKYQIEYTTEENKVNKLVVLEDSSKVPKILDERQIESDFVPKTPVVVKDTVDNITKTENTVYPSVTAFKLDDSSQEILSYLSKAVSESSEYKIESVRKQIYGHVQEYDILMKADKKPPIQVTIAKDTRNKNLVVLEKKKITEDEVKSAIEGSALPPAKIVVSDIEKENIKVLSKLGLVKDIKEYTEVKIQQMISNEQFAQAIESVKQAYNAILNNAVIVKVLQKKSLESDSLKVFYKAKDQIYQASIEMNTITGQTKLTEFIKVGTQYYPKSEVNVYSDLCYGYQLIEDFTLDANLDFITTYLKQKYDSLKDANLIEAQQITLENGRINYKLYYKIEATTVKYIVYYEPEYKRVLEVKGTNFKIGEQFSFIEKDKQITDPYFRKLDTYVRQNRDKLGSASVMHTESRDDGQKIQFRTVYSSEGKTYRSIASINKDNQNVEETSLNEVIEVPVEETVMAVTSECNTQKAKLDIHDLGKNTYFTECYKFTQEKYQKQLDNSQLLGASEKTNFNIYTYVLYFIIEETKIMTLTVEFDPLSQAIAVTSQPTSIDLQEGYYPIRSDQKLTSVRNWLKQNNPDLSSSVLISSMAKKFYFGTLYKMVFKVTTKYIIYIAYVECGSKEVKIYDTKEVDNYSSSPTFTVDSASGGPTFASVQSSASSQVNAVDGGDQALSASGMPVKLKGFARPAASVSNET